MGERVWSPEQNVIFGWFAGGRGNLVIRARAGTGKTTTIIEAIGHAPEGNIVLCAFNARIADELKTRIKNPKACAKTLHSIGNALVMQRAGRLPIDKDRGARLAEKACPAGTPEEIVKVVARLTSAAKGMVPFAGQHPDYERADREAIIDIAWNLNILPSMEQEEAGYTLPKIADKVMDAMDLAVNLRDDGAIDFDDMIFLPVRLGWARGRYDLVVVDEAQDMNASQLLLARGIGNGRIAVVGDDRQAIYGFRGADSGSIDRLKKELGAIELPLNTTYRCGKAIVEAARGIVPDFRAADSNPEGAVQNIGASKLGETAAVGDFVLSRSNAPLVTICLQLLRRGTRARIEGKEIGKGLIALVKGFKARSIPELIEKVTKWEEKQVKRIESDGRKSAESQIESIRDKADMIRELAQGMQGPADMIERIESLFSDNGGPAVVCSSVHKSKGLEADRVFVLADTLFSGGRKEDREEQNIAYVAITRAKSTLVWVAGKV
jgi:DNA helicase-2/ATP-dependent DNA helicase PcrA